MRAVYALTITVPEDRYKRMLLDDTVNGLKIVQPQNVHIDGNMVYLKGKIGETINLRDRISAYYNCPHKNGMYGRFEDSKSSKTVKTVNRRNMTVNIINPRLFSLLSILSKQ
jgi:hypothetical protein